MCQHTLQTAFHSSTQLYSLLCPACRYQSYDRRQPSSPSTLAAKDVTVLLASVRAHEADAPLHSDLQRLTAQHRQHFRALAQDRRLDSAPGPPPSSSPPPPTSAALYAAAAAQLRPTAELSGLQRFLALDALVERQRHAVLYREEGQGAGAAPEVGGVEPVPGWARGRYADAGVGGGGAEGAGGEETKAGRQEEEVAVYGMNDSQPLTLRLAAFLRPPRLCPDLNLAAVVLTRCRAGCVCSPQPVVPAVSPIGWPPVSAASAMQAQRLRLRGRS